MSAFEHSGNRSGFTEWFPYSASALLVAFTFLLAWYNVSNLDLVPPKDPLFGISVSLLFWIVGGISLAVAVVCLVVQSLFGRILLVAWLALMFEIYQGGLLFVGSHAMRACFDSFSVIYGMPLLLTKMLSQGAFIYLLAGSVALALWSRANASKLAPQTRSGKTMKIACSACGGHVQFAATNLGQTIPCPHCQKSLVLKEPENLKIHCFFCKEHIEFPAYAIGTKMACPHCKMDITLKELI